MSSKEEILLLLESLSDATVAETVDDAMYKLVLSYSIDKFSQQITEGKGIPQEEVKQLVRQQFQVPDKSAKEGNQ